MATYEWSPDERARLEALRSTAGRIEPPPRKRRCLIVMFLLIACNVLLGLVMAAAILTGWRELQIVAGLALVILIFATLGFGLDIAMARLDRRQS